MALPPLPTKTSSLAPPTPSPPSSRPLPSLPIELWTHILTHLPHPPTLAALAQLSSTFSSLLRSPSAEPIWQAVWDATSRLSSQHLLERPWARVPGNWRAQVAASRHLASLPHQPPSWLYVPPRYGLHGQPLTQDRLNMTPWATDVEDVLGRALVAVAIACGVVVGFERGLGYIAKASHAAAPACLFYDDAPLLKGVCMMEMSIAAGFLIALCETGVVVRIDIRVTEGVRWPLRWRPLDAFGVEGGNVVSLTISNNSRWVLIGFDTGRIRLLDVVTGGCKRVFTLAESADLVVANHKWVLAMNCLQPICACVWDAVDGRPVHDFSHTSVGWEGVTTIAGICATHQEDLFALWDGRNAIRMLNAYTGRFVRVNRVRGNFESGARDVVEEAEDGVAAPHVGKGKMVVFKDRKRAAVATSNRVFAAPLATTWRPAAETVQMEGAKRALLALSTDDRILVTAEGDAFGGLGYKVVGKRFIGAEPRIRFWNTETGINYGDITVPSPVTSLSVCGDVVAAVCGAVGQVVIAFATPTVFSSQPST